MIKLDNVTYLYEETCMHFNFNLQQGERIVVLGPSGAGKSTLLNLIAGFIMPDSGNIMLNSIHHTYQAPAKRPVSILFQENNLFAHLNVQQNMALGLTSSLRLTKPQQQQLDSIVQKVGLTGYLSRMPAQLSGGQRQRVALARCLLRKQPILLLDEPFSSFDPALRTEMLTLLDIICREQQLTLVVVSHNLDDALRISERTLLIVEGKIAYDGATDRLVEGKTDAAKFLGILET